MAKKSSKQIQKEFDVLLKSIEAKITSMFGSTCSAIVKLNNIRKAVEAGESFSWDENSSEYKQMEKMLHSLSASVTSVIANGYNKSQILGGQSITTKVVSAVEKKGNKAKTKIAENVCDKAINAIRNSAVNGEKKKVELANGTMTLSEAVWNITENTKSEIEAVLQRAIASGASADDLSKLMIKHLKNPTATYTPVYNKETGEYELTDAAKKFHPGRGVYRSAYKNAMRFARTEINAAYRTAEIEGMKNNPLVKGYHIGLSNNHTTLVKGIPRPFTDICDELVGDYPLEFTWNGWHPQCRCHITPILINDNDFDKVAKERIAAIREGENPNDVYTNIDSDIVDDLPSSIYYYVEAYKNRINNSKIKPFWITHNIDNFKDILKKRDLVTSSVKFTKEDFSSSRKNNAFWNNQKKDGVTDRKYADDFFRPLTNNYSHLNKEEINYLNNYTGNSNNINLALYGTIKMETANWITINNITNAIEKSKPIPDCWINRGEDKNSFFNQFGINLDDIKDANELVGKICVHKGFMSTSVSKGYGCVGNGYDGNFISEVILNIYCPAGTKGLYLQPISNFGGKYGNELGKEMEFLLQRGTKFRISKAEKINKKWLLDIEIIEQPSKKPSTF